MANIGSYPLNEIITGDSRLLAQSIPDESIDLIFTDPVYENIEDYAWLAETATRILKPDSACLVWCGIGYLPDTINALLSGGLSYRWQAVMYYKNREKPLHCDMGYSKWASLLWFEKGRMKARKTLDLLGVNVFSNKSPDLLWDWGKPYQAIMRWMEAYPAQITYDPFCGGGTIPQVCKLLERDFIASEIDSERAILARRRLLQTNPLTGLAKPNTTSSRLFEGWGDLPAVANQSESDLPA